MQLSGIAKDRNATLSGKVKDAVTGAGVPSVTMIFKKMDMQYVNSTTTDANGNYSANLVPGWYLVTPSKAQYFPYSEAADVSVPVTRDMVIAPTSGVTGQVSGTVMDLFTGKPAVGGKVRAYGPGGWWNETTIGAGGAYSITVLKTLVKLFASNTSKSNLSKIASAFPAVVDFNLERDFEAPAMGCTPSPTANISLQNPITMKGWTVDNYDPIKNQYKGIKVSQLSLGRYLRDDANDEYYSAWSEFAENDNARMHATVPTDFTGTNQFALIEYNFTWDTGGSYGLIGDPSLLTTDEVSFASSPRTGGMLEVYGEVVSPKYNHTPSVAAFPADGGSLQVVIANVTGTPELISPADQPTTLFAKRDIIFRVAKGLGDVTTYEETSKNSYKLSDLTAILSGKLQSGRYAVVGHTEDFALNSMTHKWSEFTVDNDPPVADAGKDVKIWEGNTTHLGAEKSTDNVGIVSYVWTFVDGGQPQKLQGKNVSYKFAKNGTIDVTLTVTDGGKNNNTDTKVVAVIPVPPDTTPPKAEAGPDVRVLPTNNATLTDGGSTDNVGIVNYSWSFTLNGTDITLYGKSTKYRFPEGLYIVTHIVKDAAGNEGTDKMNVTSTWCPQCTTPPVAGAGGNRVVIQKGSVKCPGNKPDVIYNGKIMFDGGPPNSTEKGSPIRRYEWTIVDPLGGVSNYSGRNANHTFTIPGVHNVTLYIEDMGFNSDTDTITVTVIPFDSNNNGLPDDWETRYFGSTTKTQGNADPDNDGLNNVAELCRGTDPTIPDIENKAPTLASEFWWLFLVISMIVCIVIVGIFYSRRPRLLEPLPEPTTVARTGPVLPAGFGAESAEEAEKPVDKEEEELKEIIDGKWDKPKEDELS